MREATSQRVIAKRAEATKGLAYSSRVASLGSAGRKFLQELVPTQFLYPIFGKNFLYCAEASCYTFFEEGDFLDTHKDGADVCEVTALFYLSASPLVESSEVSGLFLHIYEDNRDGPGLLRQSIPTPAGAAMFGRGSQVWHGRTAMAKNEHIWMLTACFKCSK